MVANDQLTLTTLTRPVIRPLIATAADYTACRQIMRAASDAEKRRLWPEP